MSDFLKYRDGHKAELGGFRKKLADLTRAVEGELPVEALQQRVADIYANEVAPAIAEM